MAWNAAKINYIAGILRIKSQDFYTQNSFRSFIYSLTRSLPLIRIRGGDAPEARPAETVPLPRCCCCAAGPLAGVAGTAGTAGSGSTAVPAGSRGDVGEAGKPW